MSLKILSFKLLILHFTLFSLLSAGTTVTLQQKSEEEHGTPKRNCHFMFSTDFFWHKGLESSDVSFGPCLNLGIETSENNYFGINYYWGPDVDHENQTYGGGFVYKHNFPLGEIFMISPAVQLGYWNVHWLNWGTGERGKEHFFGGPLLAFEIGYGLVCFKPEFFLNVGNEGVIPTYSVGFNCRVKKRDRVRKTRFVFSTDFFWHPGYKPSMPVIGFCNNMGFETKRKNYFGLHHYIGPERSDNNNSTFGSGFVYKHNFYFAKTFILSPGAMAGFWIVTWDHDDPYWGVEEPDYYYGGPLLSLEIGYKWIFFKPEVSIWIGTDKVLPVFNIGLSFHI